MSPALHAIHLDVLNRANSLPLMARWSVAFAVTVTNWDTRRRTRKHLGRLSDHLLQDIGVTRIKALAECQKPFWQD
ncbi:DUF1127 domain-containing protein [Octadecabacter sp.]|nr:DUF1127 domain-containing protein [Octadecabacter sp.]